MGSLDDQTSVSQTWLAKGDEWTCTVTVKDGIDQGEPITVGPVTINNTLPIARNLELTPENPIDTDQLELDYEYFDSMVNHNRELRFAGIWMVLEYLSWIMRTASPTDDS